MGIIQMRKSVVAFLAFAVCFSAALTNVVGSNLGKVKASSSDYYGANANYSRKYVGDLNNALFESNGINEVVLNQLRTILDSPNIINPITARTMNDFSTYAKAVNNQNGLHAGAVYVNLFQRNTTSADVNVKNFTGRNAGADARWWQAAYYSKAPNGDNILTLWMADPYKNQAFTDISDNASQRGITNIYNNSPIRTDLQSDFGNVLNTYNLAGRNVIEDAICLPTINSPIWQRDESGWQTSGTATGFTISNGTGSNGSNSHKFSNPNLSSTDKIWLPSMYEVVNSNTNPQNWETHAQTPNFGISNAGRTGLWGANSYDRSYDNTGSGAFAVTSWLRSASSNASMSAVASINADWGGADSNGYYALSAFGIRPAIHINMTKIPYAPKSFYTSEGARITLHDMYDLPQNTTYTLGTAMNPATTSGYNLAPTFPATSGGRYLEFGEYPRSYVGTTLNDTLENAYNGGNLRNGLAATGKKYTSNGDLVGGTWNGNYTGRESNEYSYAGAKYVRHIVKRYSDSNCATATTNAINVDGTLLNENNTFAANSTQWFRVEPIRWLIANWSKLPTIINPNGDGSATTMQLLSIDQIMAGIPCGNQNAFEWVNSPHRTFLNGLSTNNGNLPGDGVTSLANGVNGAYNGAITGHPFIYEAFSTTERASIATTVVQNHAVTGNATQTGAYGGTTTNDKIYLLSAREIWNTTAALGSETGAAYADLLGSNSTGADRQKLCVNTDWAFGNFAWSYSVNNANGIWSSALWWTRSPYSSTLVSNVGGTDGSAGWYRPYYARYGLRPALSLGIGNLSSDACGVRIETRGTAPDRGITTTKIDGSQANVSSNNSIADINVDSQNVRFTIDAGTGYKFNNTTNRIAVGGSNVTIDGNEYVINGQFRYTATFADATNQVVTLDLRNIPLTYTLAEPLEIVAQGGELVEYTITYDGLATDTGTAVAPVTNAELLKYTILTQTAEFATFTQNPANLPPGKNFTGWTVGGLPAGEVLVAPRVGDVTLVATWGAQKYTVEFVTNNGTTINPIQNVEYNHSISNPGNLTKTGHQWGGWFKEAEFKNQFNFTTDKITGNTILHAKFTPNTLSITYASGGDNIEGTTPTAQTGSYGSSVKLSDLTYGIPTGKKFAGWTTGGDTLFTAGQSYRAEQLQPTLTDGNKSVVLTAKWVDQTNFTITYNLDNFDMNTIPHKKSYLEGEINSTYVLPTPTRTGYTFDGWYIGETFTTKAGTSIILGNQDIVLSARWNINTFSVIFALDGGVWTHTDYSYSQSAVPWNTPIARPTNPTKTGYDFGGWYKTNTFTTLQPFGFTVTEDITIYAKWTVNKDALGLEVLEAKKIIDKADAFEYLSETSQTNLRQAYENADRVLKDANAEVGEVKGVTEHLALVRSLLRLDEKRLSKHLNEFNQQTLTTGFTPASVNAYIEVHDAVRLWISGNQETDKLVSFGRLEQFKAQESLLIEARRHLVPKFNFGAEFGDKEYDALIKVSDEVDLYNTIKADKDLYTEDSYKNYEKAFDELMFAIGDPNADLVAINARLKSLQNAYKNLKLKEFGNKTEFTLTPMTIGIIAGVVLGVIVILTLVAIQVMKPAKSRRKGGKK